MNDLTPSPLPSYRSHIPSSRGPRPGSHNSSICASGAGSPYSREKSENSRGGLTPRFDASSPVRAPSPSSLLAIVTGEREIGRGRGRGWADNQHNARNLNFRFPMNDNDTSDHATHRRASSAPPRSSNRYHEANTSSSGPSFNSASSSLGEPNVQSEYHSLGGSNNGCNTPHNGSPLRVSVDSISTGTSHSHSHSHSHTGDGFSTPCTPGHSRPPTPVSVGAYLSPDRKEASRSFSLRKSVPERLGFGPNSVLTGGRDVRAVSSSAPYAVNLPDQ